MAESVVVDFAPLSDAKTAADGTLVVFAGDGLTMGAETTRRLWPVADIVRTAAGQARFKGRSGSALELWAPAGLGVARLLVVGVAGKPKAAPAPLDATSLGGAVLGRLGAAKSATVLFDLPDAPEAVGSAAADFLLGVRLRAYKFDTYKTKKDDDADETGVSITIAVADTEAAQAAAVDRNAVADGVVTARTLVNEPPNVLFPIAFAERAKTLESLGVEVDVLDLAAMERLGMGAMLGVGQGSTHESRFVVMRWNGSGKTGSSPLAFIGKGVCFDTGGISIKPAGGMEDMKGDMAGAACVLGLMQALATRKAKVDVVGAIGLTENMPSGSAQRPGDIVKSMSGQTIEIINTDAEGRLVLADVLWYVQQQFKPQFMIDLATLTGAILVALGQENAGLFSNNDELSARLTTAGLATGEKVWRMPLSPTYDKIMDSRFADVKNAGGRHAGSITAAQFLQRFVNDVPWAHLDIAGTGFASPASDINQSWGSGWGVRLLDRLVSDHYES